MGCCGRNKPFFRLDKFKNLNKINSNCNLKDIVISEDHRDGDHEYSTVDGLDFQQAYHYPINANKTLYMMSMKATSELMTSSYQSQHYTRSILTPYKDKLGVFTNAYGWSRNKKGNIIKCQLN